MHGEATKVAWALPFQLARVRVHGYSCSGVSVCAASKFPAIISNRVVNQSMHRSRISYQSIKPGGLDGLKGEGSRAGGQAPPAANACKERVDDLSLAAGKPTASMMVMPFPLCLALHALALSGGGGGLGRSCTPGLVVHNLALALREGC